MVRNAVQRNQVLVQNKLSSDLPLILADRVQLQQVILNLLINAIEAMSGVGDGPRELRVRSQRVTEIPGVNRRKTRSMTKHGAIRMEPRIGCSGRFGSRAGSEESGSSF